MFFDNFVVLLHLYGSQLESPLHWLLLHHFLENDKNLKN